MSRAMRRALGALLALAAVLLGAYVFPGGPFSQEGPGATAPSASATSHAPIDQVDQQALATAAGRLAGLPVADLGPRAGYSRDEYGPRWADIDHNGCDQRNDALRAAASELTTKDGTHDCVVLTARITDLYTGQSVEFTKGEDTVDIDHVVPLARAWQQGASAWPAERREEFANTAVNLVAVDSSNNRAKGDSGPEQWMPPAGGCAYAVRWIEVKAQFGLSVAPGEKSALGDELGRCGAPAA